MSKSKQYVSKPTQNSDPGTFIPPSIYVINATSIAKPHAVNHLHADLITYDIGIAIITESWLKSHHTDGQFALPGYTLFRRDRLKRRGGGLAIYVKNGLDASIVDFIKPIDLNIELFWVRVSVSGRVFVIGAVYHPPKPIYQESELLSAIEDSLEQFSSMPDVTFVTLAGDFNQLSHASVVLLDLMAEFHEPTHAGHCLDRLYSTEPVYVNCVAFQSTISTAHRAIIAQADQTQPSKIGETAKICTFRSRSPGQHAQLIRLMSDISWEHLLNTVVTQDAFDQYYAILLNLFESFYTPKAITLTNCDPTFITPHIKSLFRTRNRLMHKGKTCAADSITAQINREIIAHNASRLSSLNRGSKELWQAVRDLTGKSKQVERQYPVDAYTLNSHYAAISTDSKYTPTLSKITVNKFTEFLLRTACIPLIGHRWANSHGT